MTAEPAVDAHVQSPPGPLLLDHQALVAGTWRVSDDEEWRRSGEREAVLDYASRRFGCPAAAVLADSFIREFSDGAAVFRAHQGGPRRPTSQS